jgi:hypothetical protein
MFLMFDDESDGSSDLEEIDDESQFMYVFMMF